jgi:hypothetical protein
LTISGGTGTVGVTATEDGPLQAVAGTIINIDTPITGWSTVTNAADAVIGQDVETDSKLRARRVRSIEAASTSVLESIIAAVLEVEDVAIGEVTLPVKSDVLFSSRLDSSFLAGQNFIYNQQPGNALYYKLLSSFSVPRATPGVVAKGVIESIIKTVQDNNGRFLQQNVFGDWEVMRKNDIASRVQKNLVAQSNPILKKMEQEIKYLISDAIYGRTRSSAMSHKHAKDNLSRLMDSIFGMKLPAEQVRRPQPFYSPLLVVDISKMRQLMKSKSEPNENTIKEGDIVEAYFENDGWFKGRAERTTGRNLIAILFDDGDYRVMSRSFVRKFVPFTVGEQVGVTGSDKLMSINHIYADGQVSAEDEDGNEQEVHVFDLFRF